MDALVALNTLHHFAQLDAAGIYLNSPNMSDFDGSALGYWQRCAEYYGASPDEIKHALTPCREFSRRQIEGWKAAQKNEVKK